MNKQKTILCYGDSNTWGFVPGTINFETFYLERYAHDVRWTGLLQQYLGEDYYIVEEGLNGRLTNIDSQDYEGLNGKTYLAPCLYSHAPLDLVVICLGGNDLKVEFNRSAAEIANGIEDLVDLVYATKYGSDMQSAPPILLAHNLLPINENYKNIHGELPFRGAIEKSQQLSTHLIELAKRKGCHLIDSTAQIKLSEIDGIHFDEHGHQQFAELMTKKIQEIFTGLTQNAQFYRRIPDCSVIGISPTQKTES